DMSVDPKTEVRPGTSVDLVISTGPAPIRIPDVVGQFGGQAKAVLEELGFQVNLAPETTEDTAPNRVTAQDPADGTGHKGDVITLTISQPAGEAPHAFGWRIQ